MKRQRNGFEMAPFSELSEEERAAVREAQRQRKQRRAAQAHNARARGEATPSDGCVLSERDQSRARALEGFPRSISRLEYFNACSGGLFRHPSLHATREGIAALLQALRAENVLVTAFC